MVSRNLPRHKTQEQKKGRFTHATQKFECLCEMRGTWARLKRSLITRHMNTREEDLHTRHIRERKHYLSTK